MSHGPANKEITPDSFAAFLSWLNPDEASAGEAYERLRFRLITYFSGRKCLHPDELADETINRVCLKIGTETVENKLAYVYGFARNVFREELRKRRDQVSIDDVDLPAPAIVADDGSQACLDKCLGELPDDNRSLILEYFSEAKRAKINLHKEMAERFRTTQTALRMKVVRIKHRLRQCIEECAAI